MLGVGAGVSFGVVGGWQRAERAGRGEEGVGGIRVALGRERVGGDGFTPEGILRVGGVV